ncbi:MAG TPA: hypothetical protein PLP26_07035 [Ilumatobacteraceae bacterium]|nr:hypothetical protein [Ilumatobacteraceae bacterium]
MSRARQPPPPPLIEASELPDALERWLSRIRRMSTGIVVECRPANDRDWSLQAFWADVWAACSLARQRGALIAHTDVHAVVQHAVDNFAHDARTAGRYADHAHRVRRTRNRVRSA